MDDLNFKNQNLKLFLRIWNWIPESETEFEIELKPPVNIANPVFTFCEEKDCTVCPVRHNAIRAYEKVDNQIVIS